MDYQFWKNVEKIPGGQKAEDWFLNHDGRIEWGWLVGFTQGHVVNQADGTSISVVNIPSRYNEADAALAFVENITKTWVGGFAAESKLDGNLTPDDWQQYFKERTKAMGQVVAVGAELYLSAISIANEGLDWVITFKEVVTAQSRGEAAIAAIGFLPFISGGTIKVLKNATEVAFECTARQASKISNFIKDYSNLFPNAKVFTSVVSQAGTSIVQRSDLVFSTENITQMSKGFAPYMKGSNGKYNRVALHHVEKQPEGVDGVLAELLVGENHSGNFLHTQYPEGGVVYGAAWAQFKAKYWNDRLQQAINNGAIPASILDPMKAVLTGRGFTFP